VRLNTVVRWAFCTSTTGDAGDGHRLFDRPDFQIPFTVYQEVDGDRSLCAKTVNEPCSM